MTTSNPQPDHTPTGLDNLNHIADGRILATKSEIKQAILTELEQYVIGGDEVTKYGELAKAIGSEGDKLTRNKLRAIQRQRLAAWGKRG